MFKKLLMALSGKEEVPEKVVPELREEALPQTNQKNDEAMVAVIAACMQYQKDLELAAVITAALAQHLNVPTEGLVVRSIRKVPLWAEQNRIMHV